MNKRLQPSKVELLDVSILRPLEGHGPKRVMWLLEKITDEGYWTVPLRIELSKHLIMDGHHRFEVAKLMKLRRVPVELFSYDDVEVYSLRKNIEVTPEIIIENANKGILFPYKTAKHKFPESSDNFEGVPIDVLR